MKDRSFAPRVLVVRRSSFTVAVVGLASLGIGCSGGGSTPGGDAPNKPCAESMRIGAFSLELKPADMGNKAYSQLTGGVRDGVVPRTVAHFKVGRR